jgi:hypothetical protein
VLAGRFNIAQPGGANERVDARDVVQHRRIGRTGIRRNGIRRTGIRRTGIGRNGIGRTGR